MTRTDVASELASVMDVAEVGVSISDEVRDERVEELVVVGVDEVRVLLDEDEEDDEDVVVGVNEDVDVDEDLVVDGCVVRGVVVAPRVGVVVASSFPDPVSSVVPELPVLVLPPEELLPEFVLEPVVEPPEEPVDPVLSPPLPKMSLRSS